MKSVAAELSSKKQQGCVYTPEFIVNNVLDVAGYYGHDILKKHVIDNSCGDGAFLSIIVKRYCEEFLTCNSDMNVLKKDLATYIHGIEIDSYACDKCLQNLNNIVDRFGIRSVDWDIICADSLTVDKYNGKMDFVLGNPPYVRVHNLGSAFDTVRNFEFARNGMTDLYIVFYEIGLKMLNDSGVLGYITPSSFFGSIAGKALREYIIDHNLIERIVDLKHYQVFDSTTYTAIVVLKNNRIKNYFEYYRFDDKNNLPCYVQTLNIEDCCICGNFYFAEKWQLDYLKRILTFHASRDFFAVKNGFATLADGFFIGDFAFNDYTIPVVKASTGTLSKCIFPYTNGRLIPYEELVADSNIKTYFETNRKLLNNRSLEKSEEWYGFGRTQGINDVYKCKYAINTLIKTQDDIKLIKCDSGVGVYSGLYIITEVPENELYEMLYSEEFITYISLLGKYKSGGYYTFSSKDLKYYLEYRYSQKRGFTNEQHTIFSYT